MSASFVKRKPSHVSEALETHLESGTAALPGKGASKPPPPWRRHSQRFPSRTNFGNSSGRIIYYMKLSIGMARIFERIHRKIQRKVFSRGTTVTIEKVPYACGFTPTTWPHPPRVPYRNPRYLRPIDSHETFFRKRARCAQHKLEESLRRSGVGAFQ